MKKLFITVSIILASTLSLVSGSFGGPSYVGTGTGSGAPTDATYVTTSSNGTLSAEVVISANAATLLQAADYAAMLVLLGLDPTSSPQFTAIELGAASDTTIARSGAGDATIEGNQIYRAGGTDVADGDVADDITLTNISQITTKPITGLSATNWRVFYSADGAVPVELALGADGTYLMSNGAAVAPSFETPSVGSASSIAGTEDGGAIEIVDMSVTAGEGDGTEESFQISLDNLPFLKFYGASDGAGSVDTFKMQLYATTGYPARFEMWADAAEDNADGYQLRVEDSGNLNIQTYQSGSWVTIFSLTNAGTLSLDGAIELDASAAPYGALYDSDAAGADRDNELAYKIEANHTTTTEDAEVSDVTFKHRDGSGATPVAFMTVDGSEATVSFGAYKVAGGALTPVTDAAADFAANFTGINLYGGTFVCDTAGTIQLPVMAVGMHFTIITSGAIAVVIDTNGADGYLMDGTTNAEGKNLTNTSTAGDIAVIQYYTADDWLITTNGWTPEA
jgi:hypothetical protein